jgi:hypothetical protein
MKKKTPLEIETATFWLVTQYLNQLRHRVPLLLPLHIERNLARTIQKTEIYFSSYFFCDTVVP